MTWPTAVIPTRRIGRPAGTVSVAAATLGRDLSRGTMLRAGVLLDVAYGVVNLLVFLFISRVLHHAGQQGLGNSGTYFNFVAVGIAFMVVAQVVCTQLVSRVQEEQRSGTLEVLVGMAVSPTAIAIGLCGYPLLLGWLRSSLYLIVGCFLIGSQVGATSWIGLATTLMLGGIAAGALGVLLGAFALAFAHGQAASRAVVVALGFLSGAYFPVAALPSLLHPLTSVLPTRMAIDGLREAVSGASWVADAGWLALSVAVLVPMALWLFSRAVARSIRKGTLARG